MSRIVFLLVLILFSLSFDVKGIEITVVDINTNEPIKDVSVYVVRDFIGYTDRNGKINISNEDTNIELIFTHINYNTLNRSLQNFTMNLTVRLVPKTYIVDSVLITAKRKKYNLSKAIKGNFTSATNFSFNSVGVTYIPYETDKIIKSINYAVADFKGVKGLQYQPFQANLISKDSMTGLPGKPIFKKNIEVKKNQNNRQKWVKVHIREYNIKVPKEGIFIAFIIPDKSYYNYKVGTVWSRVGKIDCVPAIKTVYLNNKTKRYSMRRYYSTYGKHSVRYDDLWYYMMELEYCDE
ncbi:MAG: carboxypeptidase-like regulatory domain-containing protein [Bacteroidales bacterium]|jgi:hypothetical protein|nr:carboxypeptidase-like regulatory domain-containing protein [Bacteroidales bacterium]